MNLQRALLKFFRRKTKHTQVHPLPVGCEGIAMVPMFSSSTPAQPSSEHTDRVTLPSVAIVEQTVAKARRTVLLALLGAGVLVAMVLGERAWLVNENNEAAGRVAAAQRAWGEVMLADERLTMSAKMAAATGDTGWIERYERFLPDIDDAIAKATALAPVEVAARFDQETRVANDKLVALERYSFEAVRAGNPRAARDALESQAYVTHKNVLSAGAERFMASMLSAVQGDLDTLHRRSEWALALVSLITLLSGALIWRRLSASLSRSQCFFLDAQRLASNDMLTGVANRVSLRDALSAEIARADRGAWTLSLLMIDLDRFKPVNDRLGHAAGDEVLKEVATRMSRVLRRGELAARYGGDEFAVLIPMCRDADAVRAIAERIVAEISKPIVVGGHAIQVGATVGIARYPDDAGVDELLIERADLALYSAKTARRGSVRFYDSSLKNSPCERAAAEQELRDAIAAGQIIPFYQPIVDLQERCVDSLEILSRWQHPCRGLLPPIEFIGLAEASGQIDALTVAVLRQACLDARSFQPGVRLSLNVSAPQMEDGALAENLLAVLRETGFDPRRLEIELTENALVHDIGAARRVIANLKQAGMTIALDDFGTGYSSLAYLSELPFDKIKIERSFVAALHQRAESAKIVGAIIGLSKSLGVEVIAEGVETERDAGLLHSMGCGFAQGYLFARPMPAAHVAAGCAVALHAA